MGTYSRQFTVDLDMNRNEIMNLRLQNQSGAPASNHDKGRLYYDTSSDHIGYNATSTSTYYNIPQLESAETISALWTFNGVGGGAAPFAVASGTAKVANLDVDKLDGWTATLLPAGAEEVAVRDSSGRLRITAPSNDLDAATKKYVDDSAVNWQSKTDCLYTTTGNVDLVTGGLGPSLGGMDTTATITATNRILVKDQTNVEENGIYLAAAGIWARSTASDTIAELTAAYTIVTSGDTLSGTGWLCQIDSAGTDPIWDPGDAPGTYESVPWIKVFDLSGLTAGNGIDVTGSTVSFAQSGSYTQYDLPYCSGTSTIGFISAPANYQVLRANGSAVPSFGAIELAQSAAVNGTLPQANGGTNITSYTKGDILVGDASPVLAKLGGDTSNNPVFLLSESTGGVAAVPAWTAINQTHITVNAAWDIGSYKLTAESFESDITTGTAPLIVASTTKVSNLNADKLDDQEGSYYLAWGNMTGFGRYVVTITGGTATEVITHNLGTRDVTVELYTVASPYETVICDVERTSTNTITLSFNLAPSAGEYRVIVTG